MTFSPGVPSTKGVGYQGAWRGQGGGWRALGVKVMGGKIKRWGRWTWWSGTGKLNEGGPLCKASLHNLRVVETLVTVRVLARRALQTQAEGVLDPVSLGHNKRLTESGAEFRMSLAASLKDLIGMAEWCQIDQAMTAVSMDGRLREPENIITRSSPYMGHTGIEISQL
ncbi:hypothetical protein JB92DRAFT_2831725 [Gautieria morchelliformis]|nr:hypothetical protein JB92DRAFT_2831725 [Gautieria morchelliformis]